MKKVISVPYVLKIEELSTGETLYRFANYDTTTFDVVAVQVEDYQLKTRIDGNATPGTLRDALKYVDRNEQKAREHRENVEFHAQRGKSK
jgi:hypothetical protein